MLVCDYVFSLDHGYLHLVLLTELTELLRVFEEFLLAEDHSDYLQFNIWYNVWRMFIAGFFFSKIKSFVSPVLLFKELRYRGVAWKFLKIVRRTYEYLCGSTCENIFLFGKAVMLRIILENSYFDKCGNFHSIVLKFQRSFSRIFRSLQLEFYRQGYSTSQEPPIDRL